MIAKDLKEETTLKIATMLSKHLIKYFVLFNDGVIYENDLKCGHEQTDTRPFCHFENME